MTSTTGSFACIHGALQVVWLLAIDIENGGLRMQWCLVQQQTVN
jgi:hypothetical protein